MQTQGKKHYLHFGGEDLCLCSLPVTDEHALFIPQEQSNSEQRFNFSLLHCIYFLLHGYSNVASFQISHNLSRQHARGTVYRDTRKKGRQATNPSTILLQLWLRVSNPGTGFETRCCERMVCLVHVTVPGSTKRSDVTNMVSGGVTSSLRNVVPHSETQKSQMSLNSSTSRPETHMWFCYVAGSRGSLSD